MTNKELYKKYRGQKANFMGVKGIVIGYKTNVSDYGYELIISVDNNNNPDGIWWNGLGTTDIVPNQSKYSQRYLYINHRHVLPFRFGR